MARFRLFTIILVAALSAALFSACAAKKDLRTARDSGRYISEHNLKQLPQFDIPVELNERVVAWMEYFQGAGRRHFQRYLERSSKYIPMMTKILKEQGMPRDLVYIALIESGFNTNAFSRAAAVGPWQFISGTGRRYGLRNDGWVDERRDPIKSTYAAAQYFRDLYNEFGDWYLAMAGYNGGEGRVRNAIEMTGSRNFWEIASDGRAFRAETRDYVPKFIAAAIMAKAPERFGFTNIDYQPQLDFETAAVESQTDVPVLARCAGVDEQSIYDLNPYLVRGATPPGVHNFEVRLPRGTSLAFREQYAKLPAEERIQVVRYEARPGDSIGKIARRFGVSASQLAEANGLSIRTKLHRGQSVVIPASAAARVAVASNDGGDNSGSSGSSGSGRYSKYKIRKGDSLASIADRNGVSVAQLRKWNDIGRGSKIHRGQTLKIYKGGAAPAEVASNDRPSKSVRSPSAKTYVVKKGDTLGGIASKNGMTAQDLMALNGIKNAKALKFGQKLKVSGSVAAADVSAPAAASAADDRTPSIEARTTAVPLDGTARKKEAKAVPAQNHKIGKGDTLGGIAAKYGVSTKQLMAWNNIKDPKGLRAGQTLVVKNASTAAAGEKNSPARETVTPKEVGGSTPIRIDGLRDAPRKNSTPAQSLDLPDASGPVTGAQPAATPIKLSDASQPRHAPANETASTVAADAAPRRADAPAAGTPVKLADATRKAAPASNESTTYRVRDGDTLWDIARKHKVSIAQLQKWNNLNDPSAVKPGTTLKIMKD